MALNPVLNNKIIENIPKISKIYNTIINNINHYIDHIIYNDNILVDNMISIVMTTNNRIKQTIFTLDTIKLSSYQNIQIVIVDDSNNGFIDENILQKYPFRIDYIKIKEKNRDWINPCVNYNIGFRYIKGTYVIIQNAEVCHIGDIVSYVGQHSKEGTYLVFDVINTGSYNNNNVLYTLLKDDSNGIKGFGVNDIRNLLNYKYFLWYQHPKYRPANFHFLTAIHVNDLNKMEHGFDYDFSLGRAYDDDEFITRILFDLKLNILNIPSQFKLMGIHQHHDKVMLNTTQKQYDESTIINKYLLEKKGKYLQKNGKWIYLYNSPNLNDDFRSVFETNN